MLIYDAKRIPRFSEMFHPFTDFKSFPIISEASKAFKTMKAEISSSSILFHLPLRMTPQTMP